RPVAAVQPVAPAAPKAVAPAPRIEAQLEQAQPSGACPKPRIIIDDYYPGGPIVPCRPAR
ncbi:MAG: hypothetical protein ACRCTI_15850, partial [Beijerinckiaceae bacterium]